jgi:predicted nucleotidyltransferase
MDNPKETLNIDRLKVQLGDVFSKYEQDLVAVYLFGSMAEGTHSSLSDIDIAVLLRRQDKQSAVVLKLRLHADLCRILQRNDVDLLVLNLSGNLILNDHIIRNSVTLYSADEDARNEFELNVLHRCTDFKFQRLYSMGV